MRHIRSTLVLALGLGLTGTSVFADTLLMESVNSGAGIARPDGGMTMDSVTQQYGNPGSVSGPVGEPPISTWDYGDFVVYFEDQYVIHSVIPHAR